MKKKKLGIDFWVSIGGIVLSILPTIFALVYVEIAEAQGKYYAGSGHDLAIILAVFVTVILLAVYGVMGAIALINGLCISNEKAKRIISIIITIIDLLVLIMTTAIIILCIFFQ